MDETLTPERRRQLEPMAGLCARCAFLKRLSNGRSVFVFCRRSETDPDFPRYPGLPVRVCAGFEATGGVPSP